MKLLTFKQIRNGRFYDIDVNKTITVTVYKISTILITLLNMIIISYAINNHTPILIIFGVLCPIIFVSCGYYIFAYFLCCELYKGENKIDNI